MSSPPEDELGVGVWAADLSSFSADMVVAGLESVFIRRRKQIYGNGDYIFIGSLSMDFALSLTPPRCHLKP